MEAGASARQVTIVFNNREQPVDGIRDYSKRLLDALRLHAGVAAELELRPDRSRFGNGAGSVVLVQYSPFCYGRWGFAPWLPAALLRTRLKRGRPCIAVMVHEPYVPLTSWRWVLMGLWQRAQLRAMLACSDVALASIESWAGDLSSVRRSRRVHHLPVGSNLPDMRSHRERARRRLGAGPDTVVLATLGRDHPSWLKAHVEAAAAAMGQARETVLLVLGASAPAPAVSAPNVRLELPGPLSEEELAAALAAADVFLAPYVDGASTRRTGLMAALQHGLPVVTTDGALTDRVLRRAAGHGLVLVAVDQPGEFAREVTALALDPSRRAHMGDAGRALYERCFDWPVITSRLLEAIDAKAAA